MFKKKSLLYAISLLTCLVLSGCNPVFNDSSESDSSNTSEHSGEPTSSSSIEHTHNPSSTWSSDDNNHWHECTICGEPLDVAGHTYGDPVVTEPTETEAGSRVYTCTVCNRIKTEIIPPVGIDILEKMNKKLLEHADSFIDHYEVRDYLKPEYDPTVSLPDGTKYGYSINHHMMVEYKNNAITRPIECINDDYLDYSVKTISSFAGLVETFEEINHGTKKYATIKLDNDIIQEENSALAQYRASAPIELDLNNHSILSPNMVEKSEKDEKWFTLQFLDKSSLANVYIHGGTIEANRKMKTDGVEDDSCCLSLVSAQSFRLNSLSLVAKNGTQCIGDLSQYVTNYSSYNKNVYIEDVDMSAPLRALTIAAGNWEIKNIKGTKSIKGMVVIDGGTVDIDNIEVDASNAIVTGLNEYSNGFTNSQLETLYINYLNGKEVNYTVPYVLKHYYGAVTFNDAITICSRRFASYRAANVKISNSVLSPVIINDEPTGYGVRYYDLENNEDEPVVPTLVNNTYPYPSSNGFGEYNI